MRKDRNVSSNLTSDLLILFVPHETPQIHWAALVNIFKNKNKKYCQLLYSMIQMAVHLLL